MTIINIERVKVYGEYLGHFDSVGYLYKVDNQLYTYNGKGFTKL